GPLQVSSLSTIVPDFASPGPQPPAPSPSFDTSPNPQPPTPNPSFDALVVGAGPTGLACGIELQRRGLKTVLVEKGCVVNSIYHYPTHMVFFTTPELLEIGDIPMTSLGEKPGRTEALKYYRRVADHYKLDIHQYERVDNISGDDGAFAISTTDRLGCVQSYQSRKIVLATGYYDIHN